LIQLTSSQKELLTPVYPLIDILLIRQYETAEHSFRVSKIAAYLGKQLGLPRKNLMQLYYGTLLHDIGKLAIPDQILLKPGSLNGNEWEDVKRHPVLGYALLKQYKILGEACTIALYHHERFDGTGYPFGLSGASIPLLARICTVADAFEAMTADRPYRKGIGLPEAFLEVERNSGLQFDPAIAEHLLKAKYSQLEALFGQFEDGAILADL